MARGHRIESVPELPLVLSDDVEGVEKTSAALKVLTKVGASADVEKAKKSLSIRAGKGKMRNRRYVSRKGPLIVYATEGAKLVKAFRNIPGVEIACVDRLNLLKLAPGGHLGRFIIWTKSAFEKLDSTFGGFEKESLQKKGYVLPRAKMVNSDLARIVNSDEIQSVVKPINRKIKRKPLKKNPLKNLGSLLKLNPHAKLQGEWLSWPRSSVPRPNRRSWTRRGRNQRLIRMQSRQQENHGTKPWFQIVTTRNLRTFLNGLV